MSWRDVGRGILKSNQEKKELEKPNKQVSSDVSDWRSVGRSILKSNGYVSKETNPYNTSVSSKKKTKEEELLEKYGLDLETFNINTLHDWALKNNFNYQIDGSGQGHYVPKTKGGFLGIGATKLTSKQAEEDFEELQKIAKKNKSKKNTYAQSSPVVNTAGQSFPIQKYDEKTIEKGKKNPKNKLKKYSKLEGLSDEQVGLLITSFGSSVSPEQYILNYLTEDEKNAINAAYGQGDNKKADKLFNEYKNIASQRYIDKSVAANDEKLKITDDDNLLDKTAKRAYGTLQTVASFAPGLAYGAETVKQNVKNAFTGKDDPVSPVLSELGIRKGNSGEQAALQGIEGVGRLPAQAVIGAAKMLPHFAMGPAAPYTMGIDAGGKGSLDVKTRGGSGSQQLLQGTLQGTAEGLFEKFSLGALKAFKPLTATGAKGFVKELAKLGFVNASEEVATDVANMLSDAVVMEALGNGKTRGEIAQMYEDKIKSGDKNAVMSVFEDIMKQLGETAAVGAMTGAILGGGKTAVDAYTTNKYGKQIANDQESIDALIQSGLESAPGTKSNTLANQLSEKIKNGEAIKPDDAASLVLANEEAIASEKTAEEIVDKTDTEEPVFTNENAISAVPETQTAPVLTPAVETNQAQNKPLKTSNVVSEFDEIQQATPIQRFTTESDKKEITDLEDRLIFQGAKDTDRQRAIESAKRIDVELSSVPNVSIPLERAIAGVEKKTASIAEKIFNQEKITGNPMTLYNAHAEFIADKNGLFTPSFVASYANYFAEGFSKRQNTAAQQLANLDLGKELYDYTVNGEASQEAMNNPVFKKLAPMFVSEITSASKSMADIKIALYGANERLSLQTSRMLVGDYSVIQGNGESLNENIAEKNVVNQSESDIIKTEGTTNQDTALENEDQPAELPSIEERGFDNVGNRSVKAYQYLNKEIKPFFKEMAEYLLNDLNATTPGQRYPVYGDDGYIIRYDGVERVTSPAIAEIKDGTGATYDEIKIALERIIHDKGQENNALSKKIEIVLDDQLSNGYEDVEGRKFPPNEEYRKIKAKIEGVAYSKKEEGEVGLEDILFFEEPETVQQQDSKPTTQEQSKEETQETKKESAGNKTEEAEISETEASEEENSIDTEPATIEESTKGEESVEKEDLLNIEFDIIKDVDTRDNSDIWVAKPKERLSKEQYDELKSYIKHKGGYYSRFKKGFLFKSDPSNILNTGTRQQIEETEQQEPVHVEKAETPLQEQETVQEENIETETKEEPVEDTQEEKPSKETPAKQRQKKTRKAVNDKKLEDFGEKIGGAKKDLWKERGLISSDLNEMNNLEASKFVKKDNVWKKNNYQEMIDSGIPADVVYFIKVARDSVSVAPQLLASDTTPELVRARQEQYIETVREIQDAVTSVKTKEDVFKVFDKVLINGGYVKYNETYRGYSATDKGLKNPVITDKLFKALRQTEQRYRYDIVRKAEKEQFGVAKDKKTPKGFSIKFFDGNGYSRNGDWQPNTYYVTKGYSIINQNFETEAEALAWVQDFAKQRPTTGKTRFVPPQLTQIHREGIDYRGNNTQDVNGQDYLDAFNFKGGEFGNWLNENDRQTSLNYGYDALMDLADALSIDKKDIALGQTLSIAFGARGSGNALAHYEPLRKVINLTKMKGAGSLAHEWGHALDDFIGEKLGFGKLATTASLADKLPTLSNLLNTMKYKMETLEQAKERHEKDKARYTKRAESWIDYTFKYLTNKMTDEQKSEFESLKKAFLKGEEGIVEKLNDFKKSIDGKVIPKDDRTQLEIWLSTMQSYQKNNVNQFQTQTDFYKNSIRMDKKYSKDGGYWQSDVEMFARAFACYVKDKLPGKSDYLVGHADMAIGQEYIKDGEVEVFKAFPEGEERKIIKKAFDELFGELKERGYLNNQETKVDSYNIVRYSIDDEGNGVDDGRNLLLDGSGKRSDGESTKKQTEGLAQRTGGNQERQETAVERRRFAETLKTSGDLVNEVRHGVKADFVPQSAYNDHMKQIAESNSINGVKTEFVAGNATLPGGKKARGLYDKNTSTIVLQYDHDLYPPEQINRHEMTHKDYASKRVQRAKNIIMNQLSLLDRKAVKDKLSKDYSGIIDGDTERLVEEFICDVLSGMNQYASDFQDVVDDYWNGKEIVDYFSPEEYQETMDAGGALDGFVDNVGFGDISYSEQETDNGIYDYQKSFSQQVDDFKKGLIPKYDTLLVGETPSVFRKIGFNALPVTINQTHVDYALNATKDADHAIGEKYLKELPEKLENPVAIFKSKTHGSNRVVALLEFVHNKKSVIVPIEIDGTGRQNNVRIDSNSITTVFAKGNAISSLLYDAVQDEQSGKISLFYWDKNKAATLLGGAGLQLPGGSVQDGFIHSIRENGANINTKFENVTQTQQFKRWFGDWEKNPEKASKVVDKAGKPLVVYHGTSNEFTVFDKKMQGDNYWQGKGGFFFTDRKQSAKNYAELHSIANKLNHKGNVFEVYLSIKNPLVAYAEDYYGAVDKFDINSGEYVRMAKENGNDGIIIKSASGSLYIAFKPTQIKSATDNIGTFDGTNPDIRYSLDDEKLTPERMKEIRDEVKSNQVDITKKSFKETFGERAEWVMKTTRVFPEIPEKGERGTFFAEFRKNTIQWKQLGMTSTFHTQENLNRMTKDLTKAEYKTFSELVYFLDLQEEAKIQEDRGYQEILLPNGITAREVNELVKVINTEASDKVKSALAERRKVWNELKNQYITLNRSIGFDTSHKFTRDNYYHHQVIEHMMDKKGGPGKRQVEVNAGRGWLKERQGSTMAINTDFLQVEYQALLQMQYDIGIANILNKVKDQYDVKPKFEKEAFQANKALLDSIIEREATDEFGVVQTVKSGNKLVPDSETYRQKQWYNQRIMLGISKLMGLAQEDKLYDFDGKYSNVVRDLKQGNINNGVYSLASELAQLDADEKTDLEQAIIGARTLLKYTAQKKSWIKETLGKDYQNWETIAKDRSDEYEIVQPRRGNYYYTKDVINEDAFASAFSEMITSIIDGVGVNTGDNVKQLFSEYAETIRLMGGAYEQWVLPVEISKTMYDLANPKNLNAFFTTARNITNAWKGWVTSINPLRTIKFFTRNFVGDLDAVIAGNPKILTKSKQAVQELYQAMMKGEYTDTMLEWIERGGQSSMQLINEMDKTTQKQLFSHLLDKEGKDVFDHLKSPIKKYTENVELIHSYRESILRYSAFLYYKDKINKNGGEVADYVASNRYIVDGLKDPVDKAYQLSKDLLGAYDEVSKFGQTMRRGIIPFYSFTETNAKRYYRTFANIIASDASIPKKTGKLLLKGLQANLLTLLILAWNQLFKKEEEELLPLSVRNIPHITLGMIGDYVYAFRQIGSFNELLEWVGMDDGEWTEEDLMAPVDKAWGMITPFVKMPVEFFSGLNFYPSLSKPRAIRDKADHLFNSLGVASLYRAAVGKPTKGALDIVESTYIYKYDYKESAYWDALDIKNRYKGKDDGSIYKPTEKSNALYYMKQAVRYKDEKAALKYLDEYFENGGTGTAIVTSFKNMNPMSGYISKETAPKWQEFIDSLTEEEREKVTIAQQYYEEELMLPLKVSNQLKKTGITNEQAKNILSLYIQSKQK